MTLKKGYLFGLFIVVALTTEFLYIDVMGGSLRPYHLIAPLIPVLLYRHVPRLFDSPVFLVFLALVVVNMISVLYSDRPSRAFASYMLLMANFGVAVGTALLMTARCVSYRQVVSIFLFVAMMSVFWSFLQVSAYQLGGINLALSDSQAKQIVGGFGPGFRTEANTLAKFLNVTFLLVLPTIYAFHGAKKVIFILLAFSIGFVLSFTRSVFFTLPITLALVYLWHLLSGAGRVLSFRPLITVVAFAFVLAVFASVADSFNAYAAHKISHFFSKEEILAGDSSSFRLLWQRTLIDTFLESEKNFLIGTGWGQVYLRAFGKIWQPGGAEVIVYLAYGGILSGSLYVMLQTTSVWAALSASSSSIDPEEQKYFQGVGFACLGLLVTGMVNGSVIAPEYWVVYGLAIHASYELRRRANASRERRSALIEGAAQ